jgi:serine/threonine protein kinase/formylglycine-generating enzyme required for sulfatase activity
LNRNDVNCFIRKNFLAADSLKICENNSSHEWTIFFISGIFSGLEGKKMSRIDKYEIIEEIARGGMGAVYKALHPQFKKIIAIKEVRADLANNPDILQRFEQEVELLAQLPTHPNIVTVRDALVSEGKLYIVMDYIEGDTLGDLTGEASLTVERGVTLLEQILSGLEAIHSRGIVHRDLKSNNILIDYKGNAYITDFGIAEYTNQQSNAVVMATPRYAAPELIDGRMRRGGTDQQVDIYAAGMLAYEMFLGEQAFRQAFPDIHSGAQSGSAENWLAWQINLAKIAPKLNQIKPQIPKALSRIVGRMMEKDVSQRYQNVSEIRNDLLIFLGKKHDASTRVQEAPAYFDETVPLDSSAKTNTFGASTAALYETRPILPTDSDPLPMQSTMLPPAPKTVPMTEPKTSPEPLKGANEVSGEGRKKSMLIWLTVGAVALLAVAFCVWLLLPAKGFSLLLRGAPAGSTVMVDNVTVGVTDASGSLKLSALTPGKRSIRVTNQGYKDFLAVVEAQNGTEEVLLANLEKADSGSAASLPKEIDFTGTMILIPAGEFVMGDDVNRTEEVPSRPVKLADYYIDKFEVTNAQYKAFCDATKREYPTNTSFNKEYFANQPNGPVIGVSWEDAAAYAEFANKRLPTEEEWEKAASWDPNTQRKRQWPWGDKPEIERASVAKLVNGQKVNGSLKDVGKYPQGASAYGVMDMTGNASEWVDAFYQPYPGNQNSRPDFGTTHRVIRGGDFISLIDDSRTTRRQHALPTDKERVEEKDGVRKETNTTAGFRCAVSANSPKLQSALRK